MIEIENVWHKEIKNIAKLINNFHEMHDNVGVEQEINKLLDYFKTEIPKKEKEVKKLYFLQWGSYQVLLKVIKKNPEYLEPFKKELMWLSRSTNKNIFERARELFKKSGIKTENEKAIYLKLEDLEQIRKDKDELDIKEIAESLEINFDEALDWIKQLLEEERIKGYISSDKLHFIE
ncbi:MAG: hypothetical protein EU551_03260 [Promethearchaeota archaeon]|nr:MAG: hypothetical protein EU551_03260 [Candidatus Lokiarchaeota archaeon]